MSEQIKNTKESEDPIATISLFSVLLGFLISSFLCIFFVEKSDELWVNIIGVPLQIMGATMVISLILFCIFCVLFFFLTALIDFIKKMPKQNFHILGYMTFLYMFFIILSPLFFNLNYNYYEFLRYSVTSFSIWTAFRIKQISPQNIFILIFSIIAVIYNPIAKLSFDKDVWQIIDIIVLVFFISYFYKNEIKKKED